MARAEAHMPRGIYDTPPRPFGEQLQEIAQKALNNARHDIAAVATFAKEHNPWRPAARIGRWTLSRHDVRALRSVQLEPDDQAAIAFLRNKEIDGNAVVWDARRGKPQTLTDRSQERIRQDADQAALYDKAEHWNQMATVSSSHFEISGGDDEEQPVKQHPIFEC